MMEEEFDFNKVGKQMPYKVPSDFFDNITEDTLTEAERRATGKKKHSITMWWALSVAASVVLLLAVGYFIYTGSTQQEELIAESVFTEAPIAAVPQTSVKQAASDTMTIPATKVPEQKLSVATQAESGKASKTLKKESEVQQLAKAGKEESFEDILKSISDDELLQLAALAEAELYIYEETFSDE